MRRQVRFRPVGLLQDDTAYLDAKQLLAESLEKYERLVNNVGPNFVFFIMDFESRKITYLSPGFESLFGRPASEALNQAPWDVANWDTGVRSIMLNNLKTITEGAKPERRAEHGFTHPNGEKRYVSNTNRLTRDGKGNLIIEGLLEDITEQKLQEAGLRDVATHDALTKVLRRGELLHKLREDCRHAQRYARPLAIVMIDLDRFKDVNDNYGHPAGDEVLKTFGKLATDNCRDGDYVGRYGGEEFLLVLPESSAEDAFKCAERLRLEFEATYIETAGGKISVTASMGVAAKREDESDINALITRADNALYAAKAAGRNQTQTDDTL